MYRFICFFAAILLLCLIYLYWNYVRVEPYIKQCYQKQSLDALQKISMDSQRNWYQRAEAMRFYTKLYCVEDDSFLHSQLTGVDISMRRALYEGCYEHPYPQSSWLLLHGLEDSYSYNRFISLGYLQQSSQISSYLTRLKRMRDDSSSMVRTRVGKILETKSSK